MDRFRCGLEMMVGDGSLYVFCLFVTLNLGEMIQFDLRIFFKGVVQPPTSVVCVCVFLFEKFLRGCVKNGRKHPQVAGKL